MPILLAFVAVKIAVNLGNGRPGGMPQPVCVVMLTPVERAQNGHEPNLYITLRGRIKDAGATVYRIQSQ